jgi:hypothetical protein
MKIHCPNHDDQNASLHLYPDRAYCFTCGYSCPLEEIPDYEKIKIYKKEPESVQETFRYIDNLPKVKIRGLLLRSSGNGYYVQWPDKTYYKFRQAGQERTRYLGPKGLRAPLFRIRSGYSTNTVYVVEGELNALSLAEAYPERDFDVVSPGSVSEMQRHHKEYLRYDRVILVVDNDPAGVANGWIEKESLLKAGKQCNLVCMNTDFNDLLQQGGVDLVREVFEREVI